MSELLYIDGQLMDLGENVDITLNYKSNMLTDLSKIVGNNSYTINLPKTMRNLSVVGCADVPGSVSSFPRVFHDARYFRNGVEIVKNGKAVLMGIGESIEVVLAWGGASALTKIVEDERSLNELEDFTDYVVWSSGISPSAYNGTSEIIFPDIHLWIDSTKQPVSIHPAARSSFIFNALNRYYGLSVVFPSERKAFIDSLIFPLLTRNGGYANRVNNQGTWIQNSLSGIDTIVKNGADFDKVFVAEGFNNTLTNIKVLQDCKVVIRPSFKSIFIGSSLQYGTESVLENTVYLPYEVKTAYGLTEYVYTEPIEVELTAGDKFRIAGIYPIATGVNDALFTFGAQPSEIQLGDKFPIVENLPEIKVVDFIKAIAAMAGLFVVPSADGNTLNFVPFDYVGDRTRAIDWSDKVVPVSEMNTPKGISYSLEGFAKNNRLVYLEDDTVATWANGNIVVGDATLDYEREAIELPFAPSDSWAFGKAEIKLYEYDKDGKPELQEVEPRVLIEKNEGGVSTGVFDGLHWSTLIANYYQTYQNAVKSPVIITESIRLDELSLRDLDMSIPVYLRQYGKYFAVVEVNAPSSGICEVKLLQLE